jgi:hypothetical protein
MTLKTRAENGSLSEAARRSTAPVRGWWPTTGGYPTARRIHDGVEEDGRPVLEGRSEEDRDKVQTDGALADGPLDLGDGDLLIVQILLHQDIVRLTQRLEHHHPFLFHFGGMLRSDLPDRELGAQEVATPVDLAAFDEVDDAAESVLPAQRDLDRQGSRGDPGPELVDSPFRVGPDPVHLVDITIRGTRCSACRRTVSDR